MNRLRELRKNKALTQGELAKLFNTTTSNVSGWECEKWQPDNETLIALAEFFDVSVDYLLGRPEITEEEYAAGARETVKVNITPLEDDLLYAFRQVGKLRGEAAQRAIVEMIEKML